MIGEQVTHPAYGQGVIMALYRNGQEWLVRFESGLRFRRPRSEFEGQIDEQNAMGTFSTISTPAATATATLTYMPMPPSQFDARQLIEALRVGVAPAQHIHELTIGLEAERETLFSGLNQAHQEGGAAFAISGDYGFGKSHIVELVAQEALKRDFLVATTSLDLQELPPHRGFDIYASLMQNLRYPDTDERGLRPLLEKATVQSNIVGQLSELTTVTADPLAFGLMALGNTSSTRQQKAWHAWLMGGRRTKLMSQAKPRGIKFPSIYRIGENARQIAYLLSGVSVLARLVGYSGLGVLIDEAESYSLLKAKQRPKASTFFSAIIYAALRERQQQLQDEDFPQHRYHDYPLTYTERQSLYFLFTVTRSDNRMSLEDWLADEQMIELAPHHSPQEIGQFLEKVMAFHAQAYTYDIDERHRQIRRGAAEHIALGMRNDRLSIRGAVRLGVELFDLLYLHPDYATEAILDELRSAVR